MGIDHGDALLALYDRAVDDVYRYLGARCHDRHVAQDLTAETFLAAVGQIRRGAVTEVTVAWLVGIARHKLLDHWRRAARASGRRADTDDDGDGPAEDPWDAVLESQHVAATLERLGPAHRSALTLRYLDGLPVTSVAEHLGRTVMATEALLVRARIAFRRVYEGGDER